MAGAPQASAQEALLKGAGFTNVTVDLKEESKAVIAQWMPGSGAEDFIVSANIMATKPLETSAATSLSSSSSLSSSFAVVSSPSAELQSNDASG